MIDNVGSKDFNSKEIDGQFNVAVDGFRQPGSSIKPVTYLMLLRQGYTPASILADVPTSFVEDSKQKAYEPKN
jgi:membrane carboxypeptidase/penicillin-binding protein